MDLKKTVKNRNIPTNTSNSRILTLVLGDFVESLGDVFDIASVQTSDGDTAVHGQVDVVFINASLDLFLGQTGVGEHTNLAGDVRPVASGTSLLKIFDESLTHGDDSVGHSSAFFVPLGLELGITQDSLDNTSTVERRVGPEGTGSNLQLRDNTGLLFLGGTDDRGSTATFTVETEVLGEGLSKTDLVTLFNEVTDSESITFHIARSETLVGAIEDDTAVVGLDGIRDLLPLFLGGIDTSGVVSTGVEEEGGLGGSRLDSLEDAVHVQVVVGIEVGVLLVGNTSGVEDTEVVGPGGVGDEDVFVTLDVLQEIAEETERTSTRKSLANSNSVFLDGSAISTVDEFSSQSVEVGETFNRRIFVIALASNASFSFSNARENDGLAVIVTVGTDTEGNLAGILISLELFVQTENGIRGSLSNLIPYETTIDSYSSPTGSESTSESRLNSTNGLYSIMHIDCSNY